MNGSIKDWLWRKAGNKSVKIRKRMERIQEIFFFLLRRGLWGEEQPVQENLFPLSSSEWDLIYRLSRKHTLQGIIYDGIVGLPAGCQPPKMLLIHWTVEIDKWERINRHQQQILSRLQILFSQPPAIPFELIKGPAISCFYRNPLHRVCGDLDLYFCGKEQVEAANKRIEQTGIRVERGMTGDSAYLINGALIEQHARLFAGDAVVGGNGGVAGAGHLVAAHAGSRFVCAAKHTLGPLISHITILLKHRSPSSLLVCLRQSLLRLGPLSRPRGGKAALFQRSMALWFTT